MALPPLWVKPRLIVSSSRVGPFEFVVRDSLEPVPAYSLLDAQLSFDVTDDVCLLVEGYNLQGTLHTPRGGLLVTGSNF